jgi:glycosyltransferase involved in cell wall biosynthesis
MNSSPKVSIIVPVHNSAPFLSGLVTCLEKLVFTNWECILVNNFSSDNSLDLIREFSQKDNRIIAVDHTKKGVSAARNYGMQLAKGEYIQFIDADDTIAAGKLTVQSDFLDANPICGLVFGDARYWKESEPGIMNLPVWSKEFIAALSGAGEELVAELLKGNRLVISAPLFRKSLIEQSGTFDESMPYNEDWEFWLRIAKSGTTFQFIDKQEVLSFIRLHDLSASKNLHAMYLSELNVYRKEYHDPSNSPLLRSLARTCFYKTWIELIVRKFKGDNIKIGGLRLWI